MYEAFFDAVDHCEIEWMLGYGNSPRLKIYTVKDWDFPMHKEHKYQFGKAPHTGVFWSETADGVVSFFSHTGGDKNEGGFGGAVFNLTMEDGTEKVLRGPWSSRPGAMNQYFPHSVDVTIGGRYNMAAHIRADLWVMLMCKWFPELYLGIRWPADDHYKRVEGSNPEIVYDFSVQPDRWEKPDGKSFNDGYAFVPLGYMGV